jgi:DNA polymerase-3 subunit alpha
MSKWVPLHVHSHFSLLDGLSRPEQIVARAQECGYGAVALTDHGTLAGVPSFADAMGKAGLKGVAGLEAYVCAAPAADQSKENGRLAHLCLLAKGDRGWRNLVRASSRSNHPDCYYRKPRLSLGEWGGFSQGEWFAFSGHPGSALANCLFDDLKAAYAARSADAAAALLAPDWEARLLRQIELHLAAFGRDNFFVEIQLTDAGNLPACLVIAEKLRWAAKRAGVPRVGTCDAHYPRQEDATDHRVLLCSLLDVTLREAEKKAEANEEFGLSGFFKSNRYHIPSPEEAAALYDGEELANAGRIAEACAAPKVSRQPSLPVFACPGGMPPDDHLRQLCRAGWREKVAGKVAKPRHPEYAERARHELEVLTGAGLSSYFLIVQDLVNHARVTMRRRVGKGRGSAAGCLVSWLMGITEVDPIKWGLMFERFYNAGRNTKDRVALPDIDCDFPVSARDALLDYLRDKYGADRVCQMATFARMQGRGALKDVLRAHGRCSYEEMNRITQPVPDEAAIADHLQEIQEAFDRGESEHEPSIIRWALENVPDGLKEWCWLDEQGEFDGPLAPEFAQAVRLEGTRRSQGKHASGVVISGEPLADIVPMVHDKHSGQMLAGVDMRDAEKMGLVKFDVLGTLILDRVEAAEAIVRTGAL